MIAPWMGYVLLVAALLALVAALIEQVAVVRRWSRRWIWVGAVAGVGLLVVLAPRRAASGRELRIAREKAARASAVADGARFVARGEPAAALPLIRWSAVAERLDTPLRMVWGTTSAALVAMVLAAAAGLARRRRTWRETEVDGVSVLVASQEGPAVVGLAPPRVVIPEWSLALDPAARSLMLRHELEHLRTRDPQLVHLVGVALVLFPWCLPLWWMLRRLRLAVEVDCDARVLARGPATVAPPDARIYGELLLTVATRRSQRLSMAPALLEHGSALGRRIVAMHPRLPRFPRTHNVLFAAGAIALVLVAWSRRPPVTGFTGAAGFVQDGPVAAWIPNTQAPYAIGWIRERLGEWLPDVATDSATAIITLVRGSDGNVVRAFTGARAMGPVVERVAPGYGHAPELLRRATAPGDFREADEALFGSNPSRPSDFRASARAPVRAGVAATGVEAMRLAPGDVTPGVAYVFVIALTIPE